MPQVAAATAAAVLPPLCVRGRQLLGGVQKLTEVPVPADVDGLLAVLRERLVTRDGGDLDVDFVRYHDRSVDEWVLLVDVGVLAAAAGPTVIEVVQRAPSDRADRLEYLALVFAQAVRSMATAHGGSRSPSGGSGCSHHDPVVDGPGGSPTHGPEWGAADAGGLTVEEQCAVMVKRFEGLTPFSDPCDIFAAPDAYGVAAAIDRVAAAPESQQEEVFISHLVDALRTLAARLGDPASPAYAGPGGLAFELRAASDVPGDGEVASACSSSSADAACVVCAVMVDPKGPPKSITIDPVVVDAPFECLTSAFAEEFAVAPHLLAFRFEDADGFQWAVDDDASLQTYLASYANEARPPLLCSTFTPPVRGGRPGKTYCCVSPPAAATRFTHDPVHYEMWQAYLTAAGVVRGDNGEAALPAAALCRLLREDSAYGWLGDDDPMFFARTVSGIMKKFDKPDADCVTYDQFSMTLLRLSQV